LSGQYGTVRNEWSRLLGWRRVRAAATALVAELIEVSAARLAGAGLAVLVGLRKSSRRRRLGLNGVCDAVFLRVALVAEQVVAAEIADVACSELRFVLVVLRLPWIGVRGGAGVVLRGWCWARSLVSARLRAAGAVVVVTPVAELVVAVEIAAVVRRTELRILVGKLTATVVFAGFVALVARAVAVGIAAVALVFVFADSAASSRSAGCPAVAGLVAVALAG